MATTKLTTGDSTAKALGHQHYPPCRNPSLVTASDKLDQSKSTSAGQSQLKWPRKEQPCFELRRSQSCTSTWLAKRSHKRQCWPRLSGILRRSATIPNHNSSCKGSGHRPPAGYRKISCHPELSTVGEDLDNSAASDMNSEDLEVRTADPDTTNILSPCAPAAKKQRISSPTVCLYSPIATGSATIESLDSTTPLDSSDSSDIHVDSPVAFEGSYSNEVSKALPFDLLRHQSTPVTNVKNVRRLPAREEYKHPPQLSRCVSVPTPVCADGVCFNSHLFLSGSEHHLASDGRVPRALPVIERTGAGLNFVSTETVASLLRGDYEKKGVKFMIVDCRYPYEYEGGHVKTAVNLFTHDNMVQEVFNRVPAQFPPGTGPPRLLGEGLSRRLAIPKPEVPLPEFSDHSSTDESDSLVDQDSDLLEEDPVEQAPAAAAPTPVVFELHSFVSDPPSSRSFQSGSQDSAASSRHLQASGEDSPEPPEPSFVVIFHCEFSSQRAPHLPYAHCIRYSLLCFCRATFLRRIDRTTNYHRYPFLFFPELYVMKGGYSEFYKKFPELCDPSAYVTMFNPEYRGELRLYKRLTKRVSTACQDCFRIVPPCKQDLNASQPDQPFGRPSTPKSGTFPTVVSTMFDATFDKENTAPRLALAGCMPPEKLPFSPTFALSNELGPSSVFSVNVNLNTASAGDLSSPISGQTERLSCSFTDISVRLAEAVVRVGRRVVAATLSEKDHSSRLPCAESRASRDPPVRVPPPPSSQMLPVRSGPKRPKGFRLPGDSDVSMPCTPICTNVCRSSVAQFSLGDSPCHETPVAPVNVNRC
ncbi:unnamed protein product [Schistocephalus solidus]|uniref:protein-tyrosine-phosphatase n=1 Tax=Schistocephalus solidus TaxID=70667 RepID=A0A183T4G8_SCHSO|nr:unnamed protein product [Schistocephalus solidus]